MSDAVIMNNGTVLLNVHTEDVCQGQPCCIHNPSGHHMADWPPRWHNYSKQMWRTCPHGFVHPDPDDAWFIRRRYSEQEIIIRLSHGCDGCCLPPQRKIQPLESKPVWEVVYHQPAWRPAQLRCDAEGETRPGFICVHQLENGMGECGASVFRMQGAIGSHSCMVKRSQS